MRPWAAEEAPRHPELLRLCIFGSLASGNWGVGSDVDLLAVVSEAEGRFDQRALSWDLLSLPVPADLLVYTEAEWSRMLGEGSRFARMAEAQGIWLVGA